MIQEQSYYEKVYAGFLGMNIGIRLGAPVEPPIWTANRIEEFYGEITDYIKEYKNFAADDDANGPVFFLRALRDKKESDKLSPQNVADAWLNYCREGIGMFWWGGYGISTEHTAFLNLKNGIEAPRSGSIEINGKIIAEQIGGQIFIDTWGLIFPGNPQKAAEYAMIAASVSHDGDGLYGAGFMAACIARAFETDDIEDIIITGMNCIPKDCTYNKVVQAVLDFYKKEPSNWRLCFKMLEDDWGYDKYTGVCHIIPNAGVCIMAMIYGKTFARGVEIATMAGWDTDCNAGNIGTILGVAGGLKEIPTRYRKPINDSIVLSGISGYLNVLDIPTYAKEISCIGYSLLGKSPPKEWLFTDGTISFDFMAEGSTHGLRIRGGNNCAISHSTTGQKTGTGCLKIHVHNLVRGDSNYIYYKSFYRRDDFNDERYMPVFSPTAYPGQTVQITLCANRIKGDGIIIRPYVMTSSSKEILIQDSRMLKDSQWHDISFIIPEANGEMIEEIGFIVESNSTGKNSDMGCLYLDRFEITGKAEYAIDISKQSKEFSSITPFSHNHGSWDIEDGAMHAMCLEHAEAMTGNYYMENVCVQGRITAHTGTSHLVSARVQGALHGYYAGFHDGKACICKNDTKFEILKSSDLMLECGKTYDVNFTVIENTLKLEIGGATIIEMTDDSYAYGMCGYAMYSQGRSSFGNMYIKEV